MYVVWCMHVVQLCIPFFLRGKECGIFAYCSFIIVMSHPVCMLIDFLTVYIYDCFVLCKEFSCVVRLRNRC